MAKVFNRSKAERFAFIADHGATFGYKYLCEWLQVSRSGFYKWKRRGESARAQSNNRMLVKIIEIFNENDGNYGSPRVYLALRDSGEIVNHKRVERLMRETGLVGKAAKIYRTKAAPENATVNRSNLRYKQPEPSQINQQWAGDITYLKVNDEWRYLAVVMDLYSRKIIGWSLGSQKNAILTRSAILKAIRTRKPNDGMIFHTDRGSEYGAYLIQDELDKAGIRSSMNRPESIIDNIQVESFFQSLKTECYHGVYFENESKLKTTLSKYLDDYYNVKRIHTSIGNQSPDEFEKMAA